MEIDAEALTGEPARSDVALTWDFASPVYVTVGPLEVGRVQCILSQRPEP